MLGVFRFWLFQMMLKHKYDGAVLKRNTNIENEWIESLKEWMFVNYLFCLLDPTTIDSIVIFIFSVVQGSIVFFMNKKVFIYCKKNLTFRSKLILPVRCINTFNILYWPIYFLCLYSTSLFVLCFVLKLISSERFFLFT